MRIGKILIICLMACIISGSNQNAFAKRGRTEGLDFDFDERSWEQGSKLKSKKDTIIEFVLKGETIQDWTELVTVNILYGFQREVSAKEYMLKTRNMLTKKFPEIKWFTIYGDHHNSVYEWEIKNHPIRDDQHEITRVFPGEKALYIFNYSTKKLPLSKKMRQKWIKIFKEVRLIQVEKNTPIQPRSLNIKN